MQKIIRYAVFLAVFLSVSNLFAAPESAPDRERGEGPFERLILRGVTVISGEGAPPMGPVDIVISGDRI